MAFNNYPFYQNGYNYQPQYPNYGYQASQMTYQQQNNTSQTIPCQMVDSFDTARAKDIDMSGTPRYYPNINGQEIYMKQLQADGTCPTIVYKRVVTEPPVQNVQNDPHSETLDRVLVELEAIKALISKSNVREQKHEPTGNDKHATK